MAELALTVDVPLGPFEGAPITVYAAKGKNARFHAQKTCPSLRTTKVVSLTVPLDSTAIGRMCRQCAEWGVWARPGTALGIFLDALTRMGLLYELDSYPAREGDEEWTEEEVNEAVALLSNRDCSPEDDEDGELFDVFEEARSLRGSVFYEWSEAAESLYRALDIVTMYPWLKTWARERLTSKAEHVEMLREQAARFIQPEALVAAAGAAQLPEPDVPADDSAFGVLGDTAQVKSMLRGLWRRWQNAASSGWVGPDEHSFLAYSLMNNLRGRRKGRDEALAQAEVLISAWVDDARARVGAYEGQPEQTLLVTVPKKDDSEREGRDGFYDELSQWELGVIASYTVEADWGARAMLLRVPQIIGIRLLESTSGLSCSPHGDAAIQESRTPPGARETAEPLLPGVFDETPVSERRLVTAAHLRALRNARGVVDQPYIVFSAERGVEVLPLAVIEKRCAAGWQGVIIAGASDLPASLIDHWMEQIDAKLASASQSTEVDGHPAPDHSDFGYELGMADGEQRLLRILNSSPTSDAKRDGAFRCLAMVRGVDDLRELDDELDGRSRAIPHHVWYGVLTARRADFSPFVPEDASEHWRPGLGVPLGLVADVQIYTTNADPTVAGKGHSPYCGHVRDREITSDYDRLTVADLFRRDDFDWCSKCGGYALRRFTNNQLDYYQAAHRLYDIHQRLQSGLAGQRYGLDIAAIQSELDELSRWQPRTTTYWRGGDAWRWRDIVTNLQTRAERLKNADNDGPSGGDVIPLR